jgi:hypothetical protein
VSVPVYSPIVAKQRLGKHALSASKKCWRRHFPYSPCRIEANYSTNSSQNFLFSRYITGYRVKMQGPNLPSKTPYVIV